MRTRRVAALLLSALVLGALPHAGCGQPADRPGESASPASAPATPAPPAITGAFDAISTTAMGITGDLTLTDRALTFSRGTAYTTESAGSAPASANYAADDAGSWAALLGVSLEGLVEVRRVTGETVGAEAPNGGLCGRNTVTFVALAHGGEIAGTAALKLAAFQGATMPGPQTDATALCGTFTYERRR